MTFTLVSIDLVCLFMFIVHLPLLEWKLHEGRLFLLSWQILKLSQCKALNKCSRLHPSLPGTRVFTPSIPIPRVNVSQKEDQNCYWWAWEEDKKKLRALRSTLAQRGLMKCPCTTIESLSTYIQRAGVSQILCVPPSRQCWRLGCLSALVFQFATSCFLVDFLWLCQFYSHTATTVEAEDASSSHSQDSGQVHKVISRVRGKHVSWPQGYQGVRGGARLEWGGKSKSNYNPEPFGRFVSCCFFFFFLTKLEGFRSVFFVYFKAK